MNDNLPSMVINPQDQPESIDTYIDSLEVRIKQLESAIRRIKICAHSEINSSIKDMQTALLTLKQIEEIAQKALESKDV